MSEDFMFADETDEEVQTSTRQTWKVLIVDDEPEIHTVTKLALNDFVFQNRSLEFISVYSGQEAMEVFRNHRDIAVVLLDVVMETDHAGLEVARYIREELKNHYTRIILRTGQPGQAPEREVIINYDINDYKSKTELTAQKLFTAIISTLRSYRDIVLIDENRQGLEKIIKSSADLFTLRSLEQFIEGIVQQMSSLLGGTEDAVYLTSAVAGPTPIENINSSDYFVISGCGEYSRNEGKRLEDVMSGKRLASCQKALKQRQIVYAEDHVVAFCVSKFKRGALLYISGLPHKLSELDKSMIDLFAENVQIAFDNVLLTKDMEDTHKEVIERLSQAIDGQQYTSSRHLYRVVELAQWLGRKLALDEEQLRTLRVAVPLHDIGKIGMPPHILQKPGALDDQERAVAEAHVNAGYNMLKNSRRPVIKAAALIARDHHEHWDGNGYPSGLKGEQISIFSRITALVDVYDVLRSDRYYKKAWTQQQAIDVITEQRGKQFDPQLVDLLVSNIEEAEEIISEFADLDEERLTSVN